MNTHSLTLDAIRRLLNAQWPDAKIEVLDNSHLHVGHPGAQSGGGHFEVRIVSDQFAGMNRIKRHRQVYQNLDPLIREKRIHALEINVKTENEL